MESNEFSHDNKPQNSRLTRAVFDICRLLSACFDRIEISIIMAIGL